MQRGEWRSAVEEYGEQCAMTTGVHLMLKWSADNWVYLVMVRMSHSDEAELVPALCFIMQALWPFLMPSLVKGQVQFRLIMFNVMAMKHPY